MSDERRKQFLWGMLGALIVSVCLWGWYALENFVGYSIDGKRLDPDESPISILFPVIGTPLAFVGYGVWAWRQAAFLKSSVVVPGRVTSIGRVEMHGMRDIGYEYDYEGETFSTKVSMADPLVERFSPGDAVQVRVDPAKPSRSEIVHQ
ncbi:MAG: DUF3592 domain-containing protein [Planctomycetaceae bacterium]|nr:DUF3592 domain-containing protein [Planctomycetaceae bacterium]